MESEKTPLAPDSELASLQLRSTERRKQQRYVAVVDRLRSLSSETTWAEFKVGNHDPDTIGKVVSALCNSARLADQPFGYMAWGIENNTHAIVGTQFDPGLEKKGNEPLEFWLAKGLQPSPSFVFITISHLEGRVVLLEVPAANHSPVQFKGRAYIRVGEATPLLSDFPEREKQLWGKLQPILWESGLAASFLTDGEVLSHLDHAAYFRMTKQRIPTTPSSILERLVEDDLVVRDIGGQWNITNLGAVLFGHNLAQFERISRKTVRIIQYSGRTRAAVAREYGFSKGYATGFEDLISLINGILPRNEHIGKALREDHPMYPEVAIRELVPNALIHQDMTVRGAGPTIEIYDDRIEITNPGTPLVDISKFIGAPPQSRNEAMAALMRRMDVCEERGSGIVKVVHSAELFQLPAPDFRTLDQSVQVVLYAPRLFKDMDPSERLRACYQHTMLRYLANEKATNASLRERFGVEDQNAAQISRIIKEALATGLIKAGDPKSPRAGYIPGWL